MKYVSIYRICDGPYGETFPITYVMRGSQIMV